MKEALDHLVERLDGLAPTTAMVLGSGLGGLVDQPTDAQPVGREAGVAQRDVVGVAGVERAVAAKGLGDVAGAELLRHRRPRRDDLVGRAAEVLRALQRLDERLVVR